MALLDWIPGNIRLSGIVLAPSNPSLPLLVVHPHTGYRFSEIDKELYQITATVRSTGVLAFVGVLRSKLAVWNRQKDVSEAKLSRP